VQIRSSAISPLAACNFQNAKMRKRKLGGSIERDREKTQSNDGARSSCASGQNLKERLDDSHGQMPFVLRAKNNLAANTGKVNKQIETCQTS
jgi:hypothetical protein